MPDPLSFALRAVAAARARRALRLPVRSAAHVVPATRSCRSCGRPVQDFRRLGSGSHIGPSCAGAGPVLVSEPYRRKHALYSPDRRRDPRRHAHRSPGYRQRCWGSRPGVDRELHRLEQEVPARARQGWRSGPHERHAGHDVQALDEAVQHRRPRQRWPRPRQRRGGLREGLTSDTTPGCWTAGRGRRRKTETYRALSRRYDPRGLSAPWTTLAACTVSPSSTPPLIGGRGSGNATRPLRY